MEHEHESDNDGAMKSKANIALIIFLIIGAFFLVTEHRTHLSGWLPGFLFQWPTLVTLAMFPILVFMYVHLARHKEWDARTKFGEAYTRYEANTPAFFPRYRVKVHA